MQNNKEQELRNKVLELEKEIKKLKSRKKYGLVWEDKPEEVVELCKDKLPVLTEDESKEINIDSTKPINILIEGDNYHALSVLNYTHTGKIDIIYIDPPYNTGNKDFKYNDTYVDSEDSYRHSKWCSFMNRRLKLSKNLLSKDGLILIHIDEHEMPKLLLICEELFGDKNVDCLIWQKTDSKVDKNTNAKIINRYKTIHEYLVICYENKMSARFGKILKIPEWKNKYNNIDNDPRGDYKQGIISFQEGHEKEDKDSEYYYTITLPSGRKMTRHFFVTKDEFDALLKDNRIYFPKAGDGVPAVKIFENEEKEFFLDSIMTGFGTSSTAKEELREIFNSLPFETPKPVKLGVELLRVVSKKHSIILDYFAGSGSSGHSVIELNRQDGGNRQFILCTDNESKIAEEVCYPRIKKVFEGYKNNKGKRIIGLGGNLKYFRANKTDFVEAKQTDKNKKKLVDKSTEMLCLKEDCFEVVKKGQNFKIFTNNQDKYLGIIYDDSGIEAYKKEVQKLGKKVSTYVFSLDDSAREEEFEDIKKLVELRPIPAVILNVYKRIFK